MSGGYSPPRPVAAFQTEEFGPTLDALFGTREIATSDAIHIRAADLAENGAVVPVKVETDFERAKSITLLASKNPVPLIAQFVFADNVQPYVATRVKLAESSELIAIVDTDSGPLMAAKFIEVTIGGCG